jgi:redox-sensitive bicupin YhaK (pirin superfamily)
MPNKKNVTPRYDQITLNIEDRNNKLQQILSPSPADEGVWIHQNAWFHMGKFDNEQTENYTLRNKENGIYIFLLEGRLSINGQELERRDGLGIKKTEVINLISLENNTEVLLMEVPLSN